MARGRRRHRRAGAAGAILGIMLIFVALLAAAAFAYFYATIPTQLQVDQATLCPMSGERGVTVVLVDTTDKLPEPAQREVLSILSDLTTTLPAYHLLDIRVLDPSGSRSASLFSKCNPGDGKGLSDWTANPALARKRWIESFQKPAKEAMELLLKPEVEKNSPIMGAIQDIALDRFSGGRVEGIPKSLIVISDMLEHTRDYSQYQNSGDLSYERYERSPAYRKFQTDLHGAHVTIDYIRRASININLKRHLNFWALWVAANKGEFASGRVLQGAG